MLFRVLLTKKSIINTKFCVRINIRHCSSLGAGYKPHEIENLPLDEHYFKPKKSTPETFSLIFPPPNITGVLHLGHTLTAAIQDAIIRWKRMQGFNTIWIPGIDHAGIATQVVVEKKLWKEKHKTRHDIGRQAFQEEIWKWKNEKGGIIAQQLKRLDMQLDWDREVFTMDSTRSEAVTEAFIRLYNDGLIYRADYLVNWSCALRSAISDIEIEQLELETPQTITVPGYDKPVEFGYLTHFAYKFDDSNDSSQEEMVVATTRPETIFGDVAVAVNPADARYAQFIGRKLWHPFRNETIPVIADNTVEPEFGTGAVKVTPAHDHADFQIGKKHSLPILSIIDEQGNLTSICGEFSGLKRYDARNEILHELKRRGLMRGRKEHKMTIPICGRSKDVVEFLIKPQWFLRCERMAKKAIDEVVNGNLIIEPKNFEKIWFNWLENIRDWCISRQLWWGHRIPAYHCRSETEEIWIIAKSLEEAKQKATSHFSRTDFIINQDEDVLDTWFSSSLQPFSVFGWPEKTKDLSSYYPLNLMETGHDIIFFWVARMVMLGTQLTHKLPFNKVLLHGIICDAQGRKMSKSVGNVIAPEDIITGASLEKLEMISKTNYENGVLSANELNRAIQNQKKMFPTGIPECGPDALKFTLLSHNIKNHFINFDVQECFVNKLFCNKIWQATRFTNIWFNKIGVDRNFGEIKDLNLLTLMDKWILSKLVEMLQIHHASMESFDFHLATAALKDFIYYNFCDIYLEITKSGLQDTKSDRAVGHCCTLIKCLDESLKALSPFMPRVSQHLHKHLAKFPQLECFGLNRDEDLEKQVSALLEMIVAIRRMRKIFGMTNRQKSDVYIICDISLNGEFTKVIEDLAHCSKVVQISESDENLMKGKVMDRIGMNTSIYLYVPDDLRKTVSLDLVKLEEKKKKLINEIEKINKLISDYQNKTSEESHKKRITKLYEKIERINYILALTNQ